MKYFSLSFLAILLMQSAFGQIVTNTPKPSKEKSKKDTSIIIYGEFGINKSFRDLQSNPDFLNKPLGKRADETNLTVYSGTLGMTIPIAKYLYVDGGFSFMQQGEQYTWKSTTSDSTFAYQTNYNYLALPVQLKFQTGKQLKFFIGTGLAPQMFQSYRQRQQWSDSLGAKSSAVVKQNYDCGTFNLAWITSAGVQLQFNGNMGIRLSGMFRKQLLDTYSKYADYIHKGFAYGLNIGITYKF